MIPRPFRHYNLVCFFSEHLGRGGVWFLQAREAGCPTQETQKIYDVRNGSKLSGMKDDFDASKLKPVKTEERHQKLEGQGRP